VYREKIKMPTKSAHKIPPKKKNRPAHRPKKKHPGGRPVKYIPEMNNIVYELCAHRGFQRGKLAKILQIHRQTIYQWEKDYPKFSDSITKGMDDWNNQGIKKALISRATGYRYTETTKEANDSGGLEITKTVRKHVAPDVSAIKHWQVNRDSDNWRDKKDVEHSGNIGIRKLADDEIDKELAELEENG
jgi:transposase